MIKYVKPWCSCCEYCIYEANLRFCQLEEKSIQLFSNINRDSTLVIVLSVKLKDD